MADEIRTYVVTLSTPQGPAQLEIPTSLGFEAAGRRAIFHAASAGWGDLPDVKVTSCTLLEEDV